MVINHLLSFMGYCPYDSHLMLISLFPYYAHDMINIYIYYNELYDDCVPLHHYWLITVNIYYYLHTIYIIADYYN